MTHSAHIANTQHSTSPLAIEWNEPDASDIAQQDTRVDAAMKGLTRLYNNGLPLLKCAQRTDDLDDIERAAQRMRAQSDTLVLVGIGGSSLGAEALSAIAEVNNDHALLIMDNPDPDSFEQYKRFIEPEHTSWLFVSKSGGTLETLSQTLVVVKWLEEVLGKDALAERCYAVSEERESPLHSLAQHFGMTQLPHDPDLGGRWSCVSNVGLLPAAYVGVDIRAFRQGTNAALQHALSAPIAANQALQGALYSVRQCEQGRNIHAIMPYTDALDATASWCRQLISESLGKGGQGMTPLAALGTVDQHSMLQLMLDGPDDKYFTLITTQQQGRGDVIPSDLAQLCGLDYLGGQPLGNVLDAFQQGTIGSLQAAGRALRTIHVPVVDAFHLGAVLMHFMLETILIAQMIEVDAFDQPAVEDSKVRAKHVLRQQ